MKRPHWTIDELEILKSRYGKVSASEIKLLLPGRSAHSIHQKASRLELRGDKKLSAVKYKDIKHDYFSVPCEENAYWAGFIAADGCVHGGKMVQFFQSSKEVIEAFAKSISYKGPVREKASPLSGRTNYSVTVYSRQMAADLATVFGIVERKSLTLKPPPELDRVCELAFLAGYIDGDGSISRTKSSRRLGVSVVGTEQFLGWACRIIGHGRPYKKKRSVGRVCGQHDLWCVSWSGNKALKAINLMKEASVASQFYLKRKWGVADDE